MRDARLISGPKTYYEDLERAWEVVQKLYPAARKQGSIGAWSWSIGDEIVAEAWLHAVKPGWWVRIKPAK